MSTAMLFTDGGHQAVRLPKSMRFEGVAEVDAVQDGASIILTPKRKSWSSFADSPKADKSFLAERPDIFEPGRVQFD